MTDPFLEAQRAELESAWPGVRLPWEDFVRTAIEVRDASRRAGHDIEWKDLRLSDLYLRAALLASDRAALSIFEREMMAKVERAIRRVDPSPAFADEVKQILRERILVGSEGEPPRIAQYSGRGAFDRWLSLSAGRIALNLKRNVRRERELEDGVLGELAADDDPELELVWARTRALYQEALARGLGRLTSRERTLLKQHYLDRLVIDDLGAIYHVHRTTAFRWLQRAQDRLREETRAALREMRIDTSTISSMERAAASRLSLSITRLLRES